MNKIVKYSATVLIVAGLFGINAQTANAATGYQRLTHNAYAYNYNGQRANHKLYRKGSKVRVIGSITLNGKKYNIIQGNIYIKAANFKKNNVSNTDLGEGYETSLLRNSYIYNSKGQRIKGLKLRKGHSVTYYGQPIRIKGKKYVLIGKNQYVRSSNVLLSYNGPIDQNNVDKGKNTKNNNSNSSSNTTNSNILTNTNVNDGNQAANNTPISNNQSSNTNNNQTATNSEFPTEDDYKALNALLNKADSVDDDDEGASSYATRKPFEDATSKGWDCMNNYMLSKSIPTTYTKIDLQKMMSDIETTMKNLDGFSKDENKPVVIIENSVNGRKVDLTPAVKQQILDFVNKWKGSTDAHFMDNDDQIAYTTPDGSSQKLWIWSVARQKDVNNFPWSHKDSNK